MKEFLKALVKAESTAETGELAAARVVADELFKSGIESEITEWGSGRANVVSTVKGQDRRAGMLFVCHLDVVPPGQSPWKYEPFGAAESDGKIFGRGSCDMKAGIAAIVSAVRELVDSGQKLKGDVVLACTAGEEVDSCGTLRFIEENRGDLRDLAAVVVPEPTSLKVVTAHRGQLWLRIITRGKTAHGSAPHLGVNAIDSMNLLLSALSGYELPGGRHELLDRATLSVNMISGGKARNVIPDECSIEVDIRPLPGADNERIIADLGGMFDRIRSENPQFQAEIEVLRRLWGLETDPEDEFVRRTLSATNADRASGVMFGTDAVHFRQLGAPIVILGPGDPAMAHQPDEYVELAEVARAAEIYKEIILRQLA